MNQWKLANNTGMTKQKNFGSQLIENPFLKNGGPEKGRFVG